jgi:hypothetical protein
LNGRDRSGAPDPRSAASLADSLPFDHGASLTTVFGLLSGNVRRSVEALQDEIRSLEAESGAELDGTARDQAAVMLRLCDDLLDLTNATLGRTPD